MAAQYKSMGLQEFFNACLAVDWYVKLPTNIYVLAPVTLIGEAGDMYPLNPRGQCVFFDEKIQRCKIYEVRPYECRKYIHTDKEEKMNREHDMVARAWEGYQDQIKELLGKPPRAAEPKSYSDMFTNIKR